AGEAAARAAGARVRAARLEPGAPGGHPRDRRDQCRPGRARGRGALPLRPVLSAERAADPAAAAARATFRPRGALRIPARAARARAPRESRETRADWHGRCTMAGQTGDAGGPFQRRLPMRHPHLLGRALRLAMPVAAALVFAAGPAAAADDIRIGHIYSKSGPLEAYGKQTATGFNMGLEYATGGTMMVNGRKLVVIEKDD